MTSCDNLEATLAESIRQAQIQRGAMTGLGGASSQLPAPLATAIATAATHTGNRSRVPDELVRALNAPLPPEALKPHPTKEYLSSVKAIYVIERMNDVFGVGGWTYRTDVIEQGQPTQVPDKDRAGQTKEKPGMVVVRVVLRVPEFGVRLEQFGGSDNADRGDAFKGAVTDALTKICSYLGIAMDVYKGYGPTKTNPHPKPAPATRAPIVTPPPPIRELRIVPDLPQLPRKPWSNKGECKRAFLKLRDQLGSVVFEEELGRFSLSTADITTVNFKSGMQAAEAFQSLILCAERQLGVQ